MPGPCGAPTLAWEHPSTKELTVCAIFVFLLAALVFFGLGFAVHLLWFVAVVFFLFWLVGFAFGRGRRAGRR